MPQALVCSSSLKSTIAAQQKNHRELQSISGLGVRPARVSARQCATTRAQYSCVSGTTSSATPAVRAHLAPQREQ